MKNWLIRPILLALGSLGSILTLYAPLHASATIKFSAVTDPETTWDLNALTTDGCSCPAGFYPITYTLTATVAGGSKTGGMLAIAVSDMGTSVTSASGPASTCSNGGGVTFPLGTTTIDAAMCLQPSSSIVGITITLNFGSNSPPGPVSLTTSAVSAGGGQSSLCCNASCTPDCYANFYDVLGYSDSR